MRQFPQCKMLDCFANVEHTCRALDNNSFFGDCPFYKPTSRTFNREVIEADIKKYREAHYDIQG